MALCIIYVDKFMFENPKISWEGEASTNINSIGEDKVILLNTNYGEGITKHIQKFNNDSWSDIGDITDKYTVSKLAIGSHRYRVKVIKDGKILYSNELIINTFEDISIKYIGDTSQDITKIGFKKKLSNKVSNYTLVIVKGKDEYRFENTLSFRGDSFITEVYVEVEYNDGTKLNSNRLPFSYGDELDENGIDQSAAQQSPPPGSSPNTNPAAVPQGQPSPPATAGGGTNPAAPQASAPQASTPVSPQQPPTVAGNTVGADAGQGQQVATQQDPAAAPAAQPQGNPAQPQNNPGAGGAFQGNDRGYNEQTGTGQDQGLSKYGIQWGDNTTADKTGVLSRETIRYSKKNLKIQVKYNDQAWKEANIIQEGGAAGILLEVGLTYIRGIDRKKKYSNMLVYNREKLKTVLLEWSSGGTGNRTGVKNSPISLKIGYYNVYNIKRKDMYIYVDDRLSVRPVNNFQYILEGNKMSFQFKVTYTNGDVLSSNILNIFALKEPRLTWDSGSVDAREGNDKSITIVKEDMTEGIEYKVYEFISDDFRDLPINFTTTPANWYQPITNTTRPVSGNRYYRYIMISNTVPPARSNMLTYRSIMDLPAGKITWQGTFDDTIYKSKNNIVVNADPVPRGDYYTLRLESYFYKINYTDSQLSTRLSNDYKLKGDRLYRDPGHTIQYSKLRFAFNNNSFIEGTTVAEMEEARRHIDLENESEISSTKIPATEKQIEFWKEDQSDAIYNLQYSYRKLRVYAVPPKTIYLREQDVIETLGYRLIIDPKKYERYGIEVPRPQINWERAGHIERVNHLTDLMASFQEKALLAFTVGVEVDEPNEKLFFYGIQKDHPEWLKKRFLTQFYTTDDYIKDTVEFSEVVPMLRDMPFGLNVIQLVYWRTNALGQKFAYNIGKPIYSVNISPEFSFSDLYSRSLYRQFKPEITLKVNPFVYSTKENFDVFQTGKAVLKYPGASVPDNKDYGYRSTYVQFQDFTGQWVDSTEFIQHKYIGHIEVNLSHFRFKEPGLYILRMKEKHPKLPPIYSNEIYILFSSNLLFFDNVQYYIVDNIYLRNTHGLYDSIRNNHNIYINEINSNFTYQFQVCANWDEWNFIDVGLPFNNRSVFRLEEVLDAGYANAVTQIRLKIVYKNVAFYSNCIYAALSAAEMHWVPDVKYNVSGDNAYGLFPMKIRVSNIYRKLKAKNDYEKKWHPPYEGDFPFGYSFFNHYYDIYNNAGNTEMTIPSEILKMSPVKTGALPDTYVTGSDYDLVNRKGNLKEIKDVPDNERAIVPDFDIEIEDTNISQNNESYEYAMRWIDGYGFTHVIHNVLSGMRMNNDLAIISEGYRFERLYEVKRDYPDAADYYYMYENSIIRVSDYTNTSTSVGDQITYILQKANLGLIEYTDNSYSDLFTLEDKDSGYYYIDKDLGEGKYRLKVVVGDKFTYYTDPIDKMSYDGILKVNGKYSFVGRNIYDSAIAPIDASAYTIDCDIERFGEDIEFQIEWCHSLTHMFVNDQVNVVDGKNVIDQVSFVPVGQKFNKTNKPNINNTVGRRQGLTRVRLKVYKGEEVIGYSNVIWIYLDVSTSYFVQGEYLNENITMPEVSDSSIERPRYDRIINSRVFSIKTEHTYPEQQSDWYITTWWGENQYEKYGRKFATATGDELVTNINRTKTIYKFNRKTKVPLFNIPFEIREYELEQVVMEMDLNIEHRFVDELYTRERVPFTVKTHSLSSKFGAFLIMNYNAGGPNFNFTKRLWRKALGSGDSSKEAANAQPVGERGQPIGTDGQRRDKYTSNKVESGATEYKAEIIYKNRIISHTNWVSQLHFRPLLSLTQSAVGYDNVMFQKVDLTAPLPRPAGSTQPAVRPQPNARNLYTRNIYMNRFEEGYKYQLEVKSQSYNEAGTTVDQNGFRTQGGFITQAQAIPVELSTNNFYAFRLKIFRGDQHIGYSTMIFLKT